MDKLEFVDDAVEIRQALFNFNKQANAYEDRSYVLTRQTTYWVHEPRLGVFGPNKFVAYKNMTFERYENALYGEFYGDPHDGHAARRAVERILGPYRDNIVLAEQLIEWANSRYGAMAMNGISAQKWRFVSLPR